VIDAAVNEKIIALHYAFSVSPFPGMIETVPAYSSLAVFYNIAIVKRHRNKEAPVHELVKERVERILANQAHSYQHNSTLIEVPVLYNGDDLQEVAGLRNITVEELISIHTADAYRVYMIGFQPGFAYMGKLDDRIATPRRTSPRTTVPAGSVGIAGSQTGIYPLRSPGGWQLLGQTPLRIFNKEKEQPCLLKAGDMVRFVPISQQAFEKNNEY
jgi:inhibitor of KinA